MSSALNLIKLYFPKVTSVSDAKEDAIIEVTDKDRFSSKSMDHRECALAVACKRAMKVDGAIVSVGRAYLIKGAEAVRYIVPESVSREITSFDRGGQFYSGIYTLKAAPKGMKLGADKRSLSNGHSKTAKKRRKLKITQGIRHVLQ